MANQAYSEATDLMVGAGKIYFRRFDDPNQLHFLGNVSEFNITTDVTTVEKYSSMNRKRELMASVTTQTQASGSMVLNEYNMYNLALGLYGVESVYTQAATQLTNAPYIVPSVPGIIELRDVDGNRYANVTNVSVGPLGTIPASATFSAASNVSNNGTTWTDVGTPGGGTITVNGAGYTGTTAGTYVLRLDTLTGTATAPGDLDGLTITAASNVLNMSSGGISATGTTALDTMTLTIDGIVFTLNVGSTDVFNPTSSGSYVTVNVTPAMGSYVEGKDYTIESEDIRAGLIKIKKGGAIHAGDTVCVTATIPGESYITVSGAYAGKIEGELLFSGDPNQGNALMIEAWKVNIKPDGDMSGLIGEDFGEFTLSFNVMSDYENHPDYPLYKVTKLAENVDVANNNGVYNPNE